MAENTPLIYKKIIEVMADINAIGKDRRNQCGCMGKYEALCHRSKSRKTLLLYNNVHAKVSARIRHDDEAKKLLLHTQLTINHLTALLQ